jgi:integrase
MANPHLTAAERLEILARERQRLASCEHAQTTRTGYTHDCVMFRRWCGEMELAALPATPDALALYVTHLLTSGRKVATAQRRVSAVAYMHREAGLSSPATPDIRRLMRNARRLKLDGVRKVRPLTLDHIRAIAAALASEDTPLAMRDRALILTGFASALRSANLVALRLQDAEFCPEGVRLVIRRSKTDQTGRGAFIGLPHGKHPETDPVQALLAWLARRGTSPGPLFTRFDSKSAALPLQPERICQIVQHAVRRIGLDEWQLFGSHSMRAGFVTIARKSGVPDWMIASQTMHRDFKLIGEYWRPDGVWEKNPLALIDL